MAVLSRRQLLIGAGISAAGATAGLFLPGARRQADRQTDLKFDFLVRKDDGALQKLALQNPGLFYEKFYEKSVVVTAFQPGSLTDIIKSGAADYITRKGAKETEENFDSKVTGYAFTEGASRLRAIPEPEKKYAESYQEYCTFAGEFLYRVPELSSLPRPQLDFRFPQDNQRRRGVIPAYICRGFLEEWKIATAFQLADGREVKALVPAFSLPAIGGKVHGLRMNANGLPTDACTIMLCTVNHHHLQAPFSEISGLMLYEGIERYVAQEEDRIRRGEYAPTGTEMAANVETLMETITESISIHLARRVRQEPGMRNCPLSPREIETSGLSLAGAGKQYAYVPQAYAYLRDKGLEQVVKKFMEDPAGYLSEVKAV